MNLLPNRSLLQNVVIKTPCSVGWENMQGDEKVRFCTQCKLNVHNLSNMSAREGSELLAKSKGRLCVFLYKRKDGTVITDNCPFKLRKLRNHIFALATSLAVGMTCLWAIAVSGQKPEPMQIPVDPRYGGGGAVGNLADFGNGADRNLSKYATIISYLIAFLVPMDKQKQKDLQLVAIELIALACIPILVYLAGDLWVSLSAFAK